MRVFRAELFDIFDDQVCCEKCDETCYFAEDDLFVWRVLAAAEKILYCPNKLYKYVDLDNPPKEGYYIKIFTKFRNHSTGEIEVVDHNLNDFSQEVNDVRW